MLIDARTTTPDYFGVQAAQNARKTQPRRSESIQVATDVQPSGAAFRFTALTLIVATFAYIGYSTFSMGVAVIG